MFILRLFAYLGLIAIAVSLVLFLLTRDARYLRFTWQVLKFFTVFLLVFTAVLLMGRLILVPLLPEMEAIFKLLRLV